MKKERLNSFQDLNYSGMLSKKQFPIILVVSYETLSVTQNELYKRSMIGIEFYEKEEIYSMNSGKKDKIIKKHKQVQKLMNQWKQEITNNITNGWLSKLFPKSELIKSIVNNSETSPSFMNTLSFKELGVTKEDIINKLIASKLLPSNFAAL